MLQLQSTNVSAVRADSAAAAAAIPAATAAATAATTAAAAAAATAAAAAAEICGYKCAPFSASQLLPDTAQLIAIDPPELRIFLLKTSQQNPHYASHASKSPLAAEILNKAALSVVTGLQSQFQPQPGFHSSMLPGGLGLQGSNAGGLGQLAMQQQMYQQPRMMVNNHLRTQPRPTQPALQQRAAPAPSHPRKVGSYFIQSRFPALLGSTALEWKVSTPFLDSFCVSRSIRTHA